MNDAKGSKILIIYGTIDGHTKKVSEFIAKKMRTMPGIAAVEVIEARFAYNRYRPEGYDAVMIAAPVHAGGYQRTVRNWVKAHASGLNARPTVFFSICLGALEKNRKSITDLNLILNEFLDSSDWHPKLAHLVAGAVPYTHYGWLKKWIMRRISAKAGGGMNTSIDYEYTDWDQLGRWCAQFATVIQSDTLARRPENGDTRYDEMQRAKTPNAFAKNA